MYLRITKIAEIAVIAVTRKPAHRGDTEKPQPRISRMNADFALQRQNR
jgi:hypothetical protein